MREFGLEETTLTEEEATKRRRAGGRAGNKERAGSSVIDQMPWRIMGKMTDDEIRAVYAYLRTVPVKPVAARYSA